MKTFFLMFSIMLAGCPFLLAQQHIAGSDLRKMNDALLKTPADTTRVILLLKLVEGYSGILPKRLASLDTALAFAHKAEELSRSLRYTYGEKESYIGQLIVLRGMAEVTDREGGDSKLVLAKMKETQARAMILAQRKGPGEIGDLYASVGEIYAGMPQLMELSIWQYRQAIQYFNKAGNKQQYAATLLKMGRAQTDYGDLPAGRASFTEGAAIAKEIHDNRLLQQIYTELGLNTTHLGNYPLGLHYGLEAEKLADQQKDTSAQMVTLYNGIGLSYEASENYQQALTYYRKALAINEKYNYGHFTYVIAANVAKMLVRKDPREAVAFLEDYIRKYPLYPMDLENINIASRFVYAYTSLKEYKKGQKYCDQLIALSKRLPPQSTEQTMIYVPVSRFLVASGQYDKAAKILPPFMEMVKNARILPLLSEVYMLSSRVYAEKGDFQTALRYHKLYKEMADSLTGISKKKEIARLQIAYETGKKNNDIQLLTKQSQLQKVQLKQAGLMRNVTFGGIALLLLIVSLLYNQYRIKQKANREINGKNLALQHLVSEKEWLLKEVHHRVKNNLQTIVSLLESQSVYLGSEAYQAIQESQNRIYSMSLIHQKLYQTDNLVSINMDTYLPELIAYLRKSLDVKQNICFLLDIAPIELDVSRAIPVGLIMNEIITNAIKYAFPSAGTDNIITICMARTTGDMVHLTVADNGIGLPAGFDVSKSRSLGMRLMVGLTDDIDGKFVITSNKGTTIQITFAAGTLLPKEHREIYSGSLQPIA